MAEQNLPAPSNPAVSKLNQVLDALVSGLGAQAAYLLLVAQVPWLGLPVISSLTRMLLGWLADSLDSSLKRYADIIVIRFQNDARKAEYDQAMQAIQAGAPSEAEVAAAKAAIDALVSRAH